jgi:N-acetylglucosamine-6-phosphate deacetylase
MLALTANRLYTPVEVVDRPLVLVDEGRIVEITSLDHRELPRGTRHVAFPNSVLAPAFIDLHIHGGARFDCMDDDSGALTAIETLLSQHGVGSYFPTTVTAPLEKTLRALERLADAIETCTDRRTSDRARPLGIHLEGPFINHTRRGVHPAADLLSPTLATFDQLWGAARGHIKILTIAPELDGASELIADVTRRGVCVSLGHTDADLKTARRAVELGARHATHTFNAMRPLGHRDPGVLGEILTDSRVTADIIADGIHLDPTIVALFLEAKGNENSVLITDAISATGMPDGRYRLGSFEVEVANGVCLADGKLAGSVLTMDRAIRNVMSFSGWDMQGTLRLATLNPAAVCGLTSTKGQLIPGADADFVVLDQSGAVLQTILGGSVA